MGTSGKRTQYSKRTMKKYTITIEVNDEFGEPDKIRVSYKVQNHQGGPSREREAIQDSDSLSLYSLVNLAATYSLDFIETLECID